MRRVAEVMSSPEFPVRVAPVAVPPREEARGVGRGREAGERRRDVEQYWRSARTQWKLFNWWFLEIEVVRYIPLMCWQMVRRAWLLAA